eukprot:SAG31_NODE_1452_length_8286_cov_6.329547_4_plen_166_part_00
MSIRPAFFFLLLLRFAFRALKDQHGTQCVVHNQSLVSALAASSAAAQAKALSSVSLASGRRRASKNERYSSAAEAAARAALADERPIQRRLREIADVYWKPQPQSHTSGPGGAGVSQSRALKPAALWSAVMEHGLFGEYDDDSMEVRPPLVAHSARCASRQVSFY